MTFLHKYGMPVLRRWPLILVITLIATAASVTWALTKASPVWTATAALTTQSQNRAPEQDAVLSLGYVDYFNQSTYQQLLRSEASIPNDIVLKATTGAASPILYVNATAATPERARSAAAAAAAGFQEDVRRSLVAERTREVGDLQTQVDANVKELQQPGTTAAEGNVILDQIRSLQGRITDIGSDATNHIKQLQPEPGLTNSTPSQVVNIAAGAAGGLVLGLLLALLLARLDDRVRSGDDIRSTGLEPLADLTGLQSAAARVRSVETIVNGLSLVSTGSTVVTVVSPQRGPAGSRFAHELASTFASRRSGSLLIRADLRGSIGASAQGLVEVLCGRIRMSAAVVIQRTGLTVLPAGNLAGRDPYAVVEPDRFVELVGEAARGYGLIVIDASPLDEAPESQVICAASDRVVVVVERGTASRRHLREAQRLLSDVHARVAGVVVDAAPAGVPAAREDGDHDDDVDRSVTVGLKLNGVSSNGSSGGGSSTNGSSSNGSSSLEPSGAGSIDYGAGFSDSATARLVALHQPSSVSSGAESARSAGE
ncbi:Wzz/FepE/Etk N-terminal domain-containing protein [Pseudonocardia sp. GCM10023141]|uniref:Wzz/FepE/Etk N-terminal domain-containing protein n=1 Tax=Pseudonocardia sp. GCM10023141 TaxID=3252653 RepID=UPI00362069D7